MRKEINGKTIRLFQADITTLAVDAIVNAANNHLWMGSGVAGALKKRGGEEIEREAVAKGPINVGEAIATTAGRLDAKYVIHAAVMGQDLATDAHKIELATRSALAVADSIGVRSVAFPALGTGVGGFPTETCARIMLNLTIRYLQEKTSLESVIFSLFSESDFKAFSNVLESIERKAQGAAQIAYAVWRHFDAVSRWL